MTVTDPELPEFLGGPPASALRPSPGGGTTPARARPRTDVRADGKRYPGEAGLWVLILEDTTAFAIMFGAFLISRGNDPAQFAASREDLMLTVGAVNTLVLLTSSLLVAVAVRAYRRGAAQRALRLVVGAGALGVVFAVLKAYEWTHSLDAGFTPSSGDFFMFYYALTGVHFFHVLIGLVVLGIAWRRIRRDPGGGSSAFVEGGASFWHMVDALWLVLFPLLYLTST